MRQLLIVFAIAAVCSLSGCAAVPWNPQNNAGLTNVRMEGCGAEEGIDGQMFCVIRVIDGKEKANVAVRITKGEDGTFSASYQATAVEAFGGQAIRAEVEAVVAQALREALPELSKLVLESMQQPGR